MAITSLWLSSTCTFFLHVGHPGHEQPEALHPSGWNEPLRSVPLLSVPAKLWKRGCAAAERTRRAQQLSRGLWNHKRAGGVPRWAGAGLTVLTPPRLQGDTGFHTLTYLRAPWKELPRNCYSAPIIIAVWSAFWALENTKYSPSFCVFWGSTAEIEKDFAMMCCCMLYVGA